VSEYELPLYELFTRLRQADVPLGIDGYALLLRAMRAGFGLESKEALAQLCRMLWIKSDEDERLFNRHFDEVMMELSPPELASTVQPAPLERRDVPPVPTPQPEPTLSSPTSTSTPSLEKQAAKAVLHSASEDEIPYNRFIRSDEYFPVTRRQMKQSWRYLRRLTKEPSPSLEIDVDATVEAIGRTGQSLNLVWLPRQQNCAELLLLIDQGGSMVPFHMLARRLAETAQRGGRLGKAGIYYFHNCPTTHLYHTPTYRDAKTIKDLLNSLPDERTGVLIFSDAGAARRGFNQARLDLTKKFLDQITNRFRYVAWLNPTPRPRWSGTTAGKIQKLVAMFEFNRRGLDDAISLLRGRPVAFIHSARYR
jgi:uncharacterized protein with von Willebrand factor type A (vWA) domain